LNVVSSDNGVDVSSPTSIDSFKCLKDKGFHFSVVRCWQSNGVPDPNGPHTIDNAWKGGIESVSAYMFPCYGCGDPTGQVKKAIEHLKGTKYDKFWFDIEGPAYWSGNQKANADFMDEMLKEAKNEGVHIGIYTSKSQWLPIMGSYEGGKGYDLWYAIMMDNKTFMIFNHLVVGRHLPSNNMKEQPQNVELQLIRIGSHNLTRM